MSKNQYLLLVILLLLSQIEPVSAQCSMCRAALESEESKEMAKGINNGIIYLMAIPYVLVAIVGWKVYTIFKKD